jgi:hypothetical protein
VATPDTRGADPIDRSAPPSWRGYAGRAAAGLAVGLVLQRLLGGWWDLVTPAVLLTAALVVVVRRPTSARFAVASIACAIAAFVLVVGLLVMPF